jgi:hypothetical protein
LNPNAIALFNSDEDWVLGPDWASFWLETSAYFEFSDRLAACPGLTAGWAKFAIYSIYGII